jgi:hypothetical protein
MTCRRAYRGSSNGTAYSAKNRKIIVGIKWWTVRAEIEKESAHQLIAFLKERDVGFKPDQR